MNVKERFSQSLLYAITCDPPGGAAGFDAMVDAACQGGADIIQFRDKRIQGRERYAVAARLANICRAHGVLFIVNDALEVALACGADGVHLGQDDLPVPEAKRLVASMGRREFLVGSSTHSLEQALAAEKAGADYIGIGPVFATPTKPDYTPVGLDLVRQVVPKVRIPHVAIGGIDAANVRQVMEAGSRRVAVVRSVCGAEDITAAAKEMKQWLTRCLPEANVS